MTRNGSIHQSQSCLPSRPGTGHDIASAFLATEHLCSAQTHVRCMNHSTHSASLTFCNQMILLTFQYLNYIHGSSVSLWLHAVCLSILLELGTQRNKLVKVIWQLAWPVCGCLGAYYMLLNYGQGRVSLSTNGTTAPWPIFGVNIFVKFNIVIFRKYWHFLFDLCNKYIFQT